MRRKILLSFFIFALICGPSSAQNTDLKNLIETGKYTEAEASAKKLLVKTPNDAIVRHQLGEVLAITGRYTEAITEFERAAKDTTNKERLESELRRAELLELTGNEDQAQSIYQSFVKYYTDNDPESAFELTMIARALVHLERYQDANDMFRAAIEADSNFLEAQLAAGELFTQKYNYADAETFLADALKINPNSVRA
jgi:tetratricopeptide (TPR) repeat protein